MAFNSGSTYGVTGERWKYAARAAVSTMMGSMGGGLVGLCFSLTNPNGIDILSQINGILGALVAITGTRVIRFAHYKRISHKARNADFFFFLTKTKISSPLRRRRMFPVQGVGIDDRRDDRRPYHVPRDAGVRQDSHRRSCGSRRHARCVFARHFPMSMSRTAESLNELHLSRQR